MDFSYPSPFAQQAPSIQNDLVLNSSSCRVASTIVGQDPSSSLSSSSSSQRTNKHTMKDSSEDQPKRPLSAYNIFFQVERQRLISDTVSEGPYSRAEVYSICLDKETRIEKSKRPHRKIHGMISFTDLAKTIAQKWKDLDASDKVLFEERANDEKRKYAIELEEWLQRQAPTQQVKKRLSALRRGSLSKYISRSRSTSSLPSIHTVSQDHSPDNSVVLAQPSRSENGPSSHHHHHPSTQPQVTPAQRQVQIERARNLERLYKMQMQLYNEQMRLQAEYRSDAAAAAVHPEETAAAAAPTTRTTTAALTEADYHATQPKPASVRNPTMMDSPRYVSSSSFHWEQQLHDEDETDLNSSRVLQHPNDPHVDEHFDSLLGTSFHPSEHTVPEHRQAHHHYRTPQLLRHHPHHPTPAATETEPWSTQDHHQQFPHSNDIMDYARTPARNPTQRLFDMEQQHAGNGGLSAVAAAATAAFHHHHHHATDDLRVEQHGPLAPLYIEDDFA